MRLIFGGFAGVLWSYSKGKTTDCRTTWIYPPPSAECYLTMCEINCQSKWVKYTYPSEKAKTLRSLWLVFQKQLLQIMKQSTDLISSNEASITEKLAKIIQ